LKVLIADDNPADLLMQADLLVLEGHTIVRAHSVIDAVRAIVAQAPDLILADIARLEPSFVDYGSILLAASVIYDVPLIAVSADDTIDRPGVVHYEGCVGSISKPIDTRAFAANVLRLANQAVGHNQAILSEINKCLSK